MSINSGMAKDVARAYTGILISLAQARMRAISWASQAALVAKNPPANEETEETWV